MNQKGYLLILGELAINEDNFLLIEATEAACGLPAVSLFKILSSHGIAMRLDNTYQAPENTIFLGVPGICTSGFTFIFFLHLEPNYGAALEFAAASDTIARLFACKDGIFSSGINIATKHVPRGWSCGAGVRSQVFDWTLNRSTKQLHWKLAGAREAR